MIPWWKKYAAKRRKNPTTPAENHMTSAALRRVGARYSMKASAIGISHHSENCDPTASVNERPSSRMRRQFQSTTSRGAYNVCATAMAVKIAPNAPHAAPISGGADHSELLRITPGEKQYSTSAM